MSESSEPVYKGTQPIFRKLKNLYGPGYIMGELPDIAEPNIPYHVMRPFDEKLFNERLNILRRTAEEFEYTPEETAAVRERGLATIEYARPPHEEIAPLGLGPVATRQLYGPVQAIDKQELVAPTPFDQLNGGVREWLNRRSVESDEVSIPNIVGVQREIKEIRKQALINNIKVGTAIQYKDKKEYVNKLKNRSKRPGARIGKKPQNPDPVFGGMAYDGPQDTVGTPGPAGKPALYREVEINVNRGRLYPLEDDNGKVYSTAGNIGALRSDFIENPNIHQYLPETYGTNSESAKLDHYPKIIGKIYGPKPAAPIGGPPANVKPARIPGMDNGKRAPDMFRQIPGSNTPGPQKLYKRDGFLGPNYPTTLNKSQISDEKRAINNMEQPVQIHNRPIKNKIPIATRDHKVSNYSAHQSY